MKRASRLLRVWLALAAAAIVLLSGNAHAHDPFEITSVGVVREQAFELRVTMRRTLANRLAAASVSELFVVRSNGRRLELLAQEVTPLPEAELQFSLNYAPPRAGALRVEAVHLQALPEGYLNALTLSRSEPAMALGQKMLHREDRVFEVTLSEIAGSSVDVMPSETRSQRLLEFVKLGIHHVLTGYDHLLFLAGVLLPCRRLRTLLALITCFTIAHACSLVAAVVGGVDAPSSIVEPLIAATIVFVGVENLLTRDEPRARYAVTLVFGLVHGLGFAAALRETGFGGAPALPLFAFNLGIELTQIALAAAFLPLLAWLRRSTAGLITARASSLAVALAGVYWVIERTLLGSS